MIVRGHVQNGVVVLADDVHLPEGQQVTVLTPPPAVVPCPEEALVVSGDRQRALLQLIGICKTDLPPDDEEVERILEQERKKKYG